MKYIALTIGPIYKTLKDAKKTRELWGGSYIFSYIMKEIIKRFSDREFIVPYTKDKSIFENKNGVGLFHDRFIFEAKDGDLEKLEKYINEVLEGLANNTTVDCNFYKKYFQIHYIEKDLKDDDNSILKLTPYLDTQELFFKVAQYQKNQLSNMLKNNSSFLKEEAFGDKKRSFPSLPEIALADLKSKYDIKNMINKDEEEGIYNNEKIKNSIKRYHKYYAIVHADGDRMGEVIKSLKTRGDFQNFSKSLFEYCKNSVDIIREYGGETIFAGGDDLLFFAPVVNKNKDETIFDLCHKLSQNFDNSVNNGNTTLSFGVSINYHKYPLYEALGNSRNLLFEKAKKEPKNAIAYSVTKHSGQTFGAVINKSQSELYEYFRLLVSNIQGGDDIDNFLHSIHHKIALYKDLIIKIAKDKDKNKLENFFENNFNEDVHKNYKEFFKLLIEYIYIAFKDSKDNDAIDTIYATLRFIKFVQGDKE